MAEENGTVSKVLYKNEKFDIQDSGALNRLRTYVDENLHIQGIKEEINDIKNFIDFEDTQSNLKNIKQQVNNLTAEVYDQTTQTDSKSRIDILEEKLDKIITALDKYANIRL